MYGHIWEIHEHKREWKSVTPLGDEFGEAVKKC